MKRIAVLLAAAAIVVSGCSGSKYKDREIGPVFGAAWARHGDVLYYNDLSDNLWRRDANGKRTQLSAGARLRDISPDERTVLGSQIAVDSTGGDVPKTWVMTATDVESGEARVVYSTTKAIFAPTWISDSAIAFTERTGTAGPEADVVITDASGRFRQRLKDAALLIASPDGREIACGRSNGSICFRNLSSGRVVEMPRSLVIPTPSGDAIDTLQPFLYLSTKQVVYRTRSGALETLKFSDLTRHSLEWKPAEEVVQSGDVAPMRLSPSLKRLWLVQEYQAGRGAGENVPVCEMLVLDVPPSAIAMLQQIEKGPEP